MAEEVDRQQGDAVQEQDEAQLSPAARMALQAVMLPVMGLIAAGVLLLVGISLVFAALVLIVALLAGAASVPLAALAGRRRINRARYGEREVVEAQATVRVEDSAETNDDESQDVSGG